MPFGYTTDQELALSNLEIMREFDLSSLINNIRIKKDKGKINFINNNIDKYNEFIVRSSNAIKEITVDKRQVIGFKNLMSVVSDQMLMSIQVPEYFVYSTLEIKPSYLKEYVDNISLTIQRALEETITGEEIDRFVTNDITTKVKKQIVRGTSTLSPYVSSIIYDKPIHKLNLNEIFNINSIPLSKEYISSYIIPFIDRFEELKIKSINENEQAINAINYAYDTLNVYFKAINEVMQNADNEKSQKLSYIIYNITRTLYDVCSFLAFMVITKNGALIKDVNVCKTVFDKVTKMSTIPTVATESVFDTGVVSNDTNTITRYLMAGDVDPYTVLANNIFEYNKGIITNAPESPLNILGDDMHSSIDTLIDDKDYDKSVYDETIKAFLSIGAGLDIIAANSDDYLMVFNDIISKAGFGVDLNHRFSTVVDSIDNINRYESVANITIPDGIPEYMYFTMLKEVKDYPENMKKIADTINMCKTKIEYLKDRFNNNINGEYKNAEAINELKIFFDDLLEQMRKLINDMGSKFMLRLKKIALEMNKINDKRETIIDDTNPDQDYSNLTESTFESIVEGYEAVTDLIFDRIMTEYTIRREKEVRGVDLILEADQPDTNQQQNPSQNDQQQNTQQQPQQPQQNQKPVQNNQQNNTAKTNTSKLEAFKNKLTTWFNKLIEKLTSIVESVQAKRDQEYLKRNSDALTNKKYNNSTSKVEIIDYETLMPISKLRGDLKSLVNKTSSGNLNINRLNAANSDDRLIYIIFGNNPPTKVWENKDNLAESITRYYKCGTYAENPMTFRGNDLKRVVNNAVEYCNSFYSTILPEIRGNIEKVRKNMEASSSMIIQEAVNDIDYDLLFTEADDTQVKEITNASKKCDVIQKYIQIYTGALLTAVFDRYKDYMKLLRSIIADEKQNTENK